MQDYERGEKIGRGAMADVYAGRHTGLNRAIAIKIPKPFLADDEEFVKRFLDEARLCALFDHPNIVRVYDVGKDANGIPYLIMERLFGQTLRERIEQGPLTEKEAVSIAIDVLSALECAHAQNIVHRDVKPGNVYLSGQAQTVKVMDFGIAKALNERGLTSTGVPMGTPAYMSPEQADGRKVDARTDLYGVGILLYEMLTGDVPFKADTQLTVLNMQINMPPPPLPNTVSPWLRTIVARALAKKPEARFASAADMRLALERGAAGVTTVTPERVKSTPASPVAWARWALGGAAALLALGMLIVVLQLKKDNAAAQKREAEARHQVEVAQTQANAAQTQANADRDARLAAEQKANAFKAVIDNTPPPAPKPVISTSDEDNMTASELVVKAYLNLSHNLLDTSARQARKAIAKDPSSANAHAVLANALLEIFMLTRDDDTLREAAAETVKAHDLDNESAMAINALAFIQWLSKDMDKASTLVHEASRLAPKLSYIYNMQGCIDTKTEDQEADFKHALELDPELAWAHTNLAWIYFDQDKYTELKQELQAQKEINETSYWLTLGEMAAKIKKWKEAEQFFRKAIELSPDYCAGYAPLAAALLAQGDQAGARAQATIAKQKGVVHNPVYKDLGME